MLKSAIRWMLLPLVLFAVFVSGCTTANPLAVAQTPDQKYAAVLLTYDALLSAATQFVETRDVDPNVRRPVQQAIAASGEIYRQGKPIYQEYVVARAQWGTGESTEQHLQTLTANLESWLAKLEATFAALSKRR